MYIIIFIVIAIASYAVQSSLNSKFKKYSAIPLDSGMTGKEVAEKMLHDNGITDVTVKPVKGMLTDHYNPVTKTVNLSEKVYSTNSIAAAAVAAHECGHAVQHATHYGPLTLRSLLVPPVNFASQLIPWILMAGILLVETVPHVLIFGIVLFAMTTLFSIITLPVEINASKRAVGWLNHSGIAVGQKNYFATDALKSAAYTYVVAAASSLATLFYYVMILLGSRKN
ncbi:MAG: zinc metallopeptidase [Muribaculaceae bacterium]|nr:zinc metallopeptidase [Muribaculaceae bacterium]